MFSVGDRVTHVRDTEQQNPGYVYRYGGCDRILEVKWRNGDKTTEHETDLMAYKETETFKVGDEVEVVSGEWSKRMGHVIEPLPSGPALLYRVQMPDRIAWVHPTHLRRSRPSPQSYTLAIPEGEQPDWEKIARDAAPETRVVRVEWTEVGEHRLTFLARVSWLKTLPPCMPIDNAGMNVGSWVEHAFCYVKHPEGWRTYSLNLSRDDDRIALVSANLAAMLAYKPEPAKTQVKVTVMG